MKEWNNVKKVLEICSQILMLILMFMLMLIGHVPNMRQDYTMGLANKD